MSKGLMWQPNDNFIDEVQYAARRFEEKYGRRPNACRMREDTIQKATQRLEEKYRRHPEHKGNIQAMHGIRIVRDDTITCGHFLLCYEEVENG